jgi:hypothetical protein
MALDGGGACNDPSGVRVLRGEITRKTIFCCGSAATSPLSVKAAPEFGRFNVRYHPKIQEISLLCRQDVRDCNTARSHIHLP